MAGRTTRAALSSAKFRSQYAGLSEPTDVVVYGRLQGTWYPAGTHPREGGLEEPQLVAVIALPPSSSIGDQVMRLIRGERDGGAAEE